MDQYCLLILINEHQSCIRQEYNEKNANKKNDISILKTLLLESAPFGFSNR